MKNKVSKGVTLIEILVVFVIVSILVLASFLAAGAQLKKARDSKRKSDLEKIKTALYNYYLDTDCFPQEIPQCGQSLALNDMVYLSNFPCDWKNKSYVYQTANTECNKWFKLFTLLENTDDPSIVKVGCQYGCGPECKYNYGVSSTNVSLNEGCVKYYACTPSGNCEVFEDPQKSRCPIIFINDPTCQNLCNLRKNRCHDESGKRVPE